MHKTTLQNGLRILEVPQTNSLAVTILVLVGTGTKHEVKAQQGISHFLEHMFFKGTKKRKTPLAISEPLDRVGGIFNAFTGYDYTGYYAKMDAKHFDLALDWVSDIFLHSLLPPKEIEKEKGVVVEELNMGNDVPMQRVQILWRELLYGDQPAGWNIVGTKESIASLSKRDLFSYMESQYTSQNTVVCVAGNIEKGVVEKITRKFTPIKNAPPAKSRDIAGETQREPMMLVQERKTDQSHLCIGMRAYPMSHPHRYTQEVLAVILGGMMSSRLFLEVREKLGLAYSVSTQSEEEPDLGAIVTQAGVKNEKTEKAIATILAEYKKIARYGVSLPELRKAKDHIKGKMALHLESSDAQASFYGLQEIQEGKALTPEEVYDKIEHVTTSHILKVARDLVKPEKLNLALVGPRQDVKKLRRLMDL